MMFESHFPCFDAFKNKPFRAKEISPNRKIGDRVGKGHHCPSSPHTTGHTDPYHGGSNNFFFYLPEIMLLIDTSPNEFRNPQGIAVLTAGKQDILQGPLAAFAVINAITVSAPPAINLRILVFAFAH